MKTRPKATTKINVVTLGCSKNIFDSEVLLSQLRANDFQVTHESDQDDADIVIINTCGFIDNAKQESVDTILGFAEMKKRGELEQLIVTGCLSERYKPELEKEIPEVDIYFGTNDLPELLQSLNADYKHELIGERLLTTPAHYAYFKISEGCDRKCSFCSIPLMRGKHVSVPMEQLEKNARSLVSKGVKELILIAQDLTLYGLDIYGTGRLANLMRMLSDIEGLDWIRLHYLFPAGFPEEILEVMAERPNICNYMDMPLQHIADDMLKAMRRGTTHQKTERLLTKVRDQVPGIALRTTLITGYPGETDEHFSELLEWVEATRFDRLGVFTYSHEEGTHAYQVKDDVPAEVKEQRMEAIMQLQEGISLELNRQKIGNTYKVLFDRKEGDHFIGRTEFDSPEVDNEVLVPAKDNYVRLGDFTPVRITEAGPYDLYGVPAE